MKGLLLLLAMAGLFSCATKQKPTRLLIYASAALKSAERAGAERKAPDSYRKAENAFWQAKTFYQTKQFEEAAKFAIEARRFAEKAEVESEIRSVTGGE